MPSTGDPRPPLPEWITDAYAILSDYTTDTDSEKREYTVPSIERERAIEILRSADELALEPEDADHAITRLIERGYFYEVDNELRVTLPSGMQ
ncbi:hypothetical protein [Natrinema halophilum]|uniref:Uncharacterized protein n=1 Tax=Natrinema halophilum TaxID=1699371 RepID=A0A7D5K8U7_9EURY|nr:hypothetical protein [Natrinema halophilum]QLG51023.1 hypothetical protein HYG82_20415 [Natrinema halophilum]